MAKTEYRPARLAEIIGHGRVKASLRVLIAAASHKRSALPHILFTGPPGLGKTTFALALATEAHAPLLQRHADGLNLDAVHELLQAIAPGTVLFIDEIHRLRPQTCEVFYGVLEDYQMTIGNDLITLPQFTCVGATTNVGALPEPFRRRFPHKMQLNFLSPNDLAHIAWNAAWTLGMAIEPAAAYTIGVRSKGTPRRVVHATSWILDYALTHGAHGTLHAAVLQQRPLITNELAKSALLASGIDNRGLDEADRKYIQVLREKFGGGPVGSRALAACLGEAEITLETEIEPWLMRSGIVALTPRGRQYHGPSRKRKK